MHRLNTGFNNSKRDHSNPAGIGYFQATLQAQQEKTDGKYCALYKVALGPLLHINHLHLSLQVKARIYNATQNSQRTLEAQRKPDDH